MEDLQSVDLVLSYKALITFMVYIALVLLIGVIASRFSSKGLSNFFIGGRQMSGLVVAMSAVASGRSAWLLLGFTGMSFTMGVSAVWAAFGYIVVEFLLFFFYAVRMRKFTEKYDCITLPDFFSERFSDPKGFLRVTVVIIILIFMVAYVSAQFVAGGKAFSASFDLDYQNGLLITTALILIYVVLGGFLAVSVNDTIQAFIIIIGLLVVPIKSIIDIGGWSRFTELLMATHSGSFVDPFALSIGAMVGFLGIGLGSPGNPHIIARYMSLKKKGNFKMVALMGTLANILMAVGALFIGLVGRLYFPDASMLPDGDTENLYPILAWQHLNPVFFGLVIASIFAAIISTADSQLLVAASSVVRDIYEKMMMKNRSVSQKRLVLMSRAMIFTLVMLGLFLGWIAGDLVFWLVLYAWAGLGAAFGPTTILALYWKRTSTAGVIAGILSGAFTVIVWNRIDFLREMIYELVPAFILATIVTIVVSYFTPSETSEKVEQMFDIYKDGRE
jgi:sodium/proline symporter